jgi:hypothetical protein
MSFTNEPQPGIGPSPTPASAPPFNPTAAPGVGAAVSTAIMAAPGSYMGPININTNATENGTLNLIYWALFILPQSGIVKAINVYCDNGIAGSLARLGLYAPDANGYPAKLILDAGQVSGATAGMLSLAGLTQIVPAGILWGALVSQSVSPSLRYSGNSAGPYSISPAVNINNLTAPSVQFIGPSGINAGLPASVVGNIGGTTAGDNSTPLIFLGF